MSPAEEPSRRTLRGDADPLGAATMAITAMTNVRMLLEPLPSLAVALHAAMPAFAVPARKFDFVVAAMKVVT